MNERLNLNLDDGEIQRLLDLAAVIYDQDQSQRARGPLTRSDVARLALVEGLAVLEKRYGVGERSYVLPDGAEDLDG